MALTTTPSHGGMAHEQLEHELGVLMRRARGVSGALARSVHPELDAAAYGLMVRIDEVGVVRITDLADYFSVGKPTVSRQIALLERFGLVNRAVNDDDARSRHVSLTDEGTARLERARVARQERVRLMLDDWAEQDVSALAVLLRRYNAATV